MKIIDIIDKKRKREELTKKEIEYIGKAYMKGEVTDYQMSALLMAICINGMTAEETYYLTMVMAESGNILTWKDDLNILDKHSTGGVGDKLTLVLMPLLASLAYDIAKMSGRGLGYTGGTADKLESIDGYVLELSMDKFKENVENIGISLITQSEEISLLDKKIYALRDVTATTESIPLIASSIMSKKIALGAKKLILEVTFGNGAFMKTKEDAKNLGELMKVIGDKAGIDTVIFLTDMNSPLGYTVGNLIEVYEAVEVLNGRQSEVLDLAINITLNYMLKDKKILQIQNDKERDLKKQELRKKIEEKIESKEALNKFYELLKNQGVDQKIIDKLEGKYEQENNVQVYDIKTENTGIITEISAIDIAKASFEIGGGREKKEDNIHYLSGICVCKNIGDKVLEEDIIAKIYLDKKDIIENEHERFLKAKDLVLRAIKIEHNIGTSTIDSSKILDIIY